MLNGDSEKKTNRQESGLKISRLKKDLLIHLKTPDKKLADRFVEIEQRLYWIHLSKNKAPISKGFIYFLSNYKVFVNDDESVQWNNIQKRFNRDNPKYKDSFYWNKQLTWYIAQPNEFKLFQIEEDQLIQQKPLFHPSRGDWYADVLEGGRLLIKRHLNFPVDKVTFYVNANTYSYYNSSIIERVKKEVNLDPSLYWYADYEAHFEAYREKTYKPLPVDIEHFKEVLPESFHSRLNFSLEKTNSDFNQDEDFKGRIHIVGTTGAGKSSYKAAVTACQVLENQMKCGIIEPTVEEANHTKNLLKELGISAVVLYGNTNRWKHTSNLLESYYNNPDGTLNVEQLLNEDIFEHLTGSCLLLDELSLSSIENNPPCNLLYESGSKVDCPYYAKCGSLKRYGDLLEADVWITTPAFLVKGSIPSGYDRYGRTPYELFNAYLDFIIVDEVDDCQNKLDELFLEETDINTGEHNLSIRLKQLADYIEKSLSRDGQSDDLLLLKRAIQRFQMKLDNCCFFAGQFKSLDNFADENCLSINFFKGYFEVLLEDSPAKKTFLLQISEYINFISQENNEKNPYNNPFTLLTLIRKDPNHLNIQNNYFNKVLKEISATLSSLKIRVIDDYSWEEFEELFMLFILIADLEISLQEVRDQFDLNKEKISKEILMNTKGLERFGNRLQQFISDPCIPNLSGFWLNLCQNEVQIKSLDYVGVGRDLLYRLSWKIAPKTEPPALLMLSATSHAPGSAHYHMSHHPDYVLRNKKSNGKINAYYKPVSFAGDKLERVSGQYGEKRIESLTNEVRALVSHLRQDILFNKSKSLIVVNSYTDALTVAKVLEREGFNFKVILKDTTKMEDYSLTQHQLKRFEKESGEANLCIVPLSIISRGHNILNSKGDSYFNTAYFLIRPYLIPGDINTCIKIIHAKQFAIQKNLQVMPGSILEKYNHWKEYNEKTFQQSLKIGTWKGLSPYYRTVLAWYMLIQIIQTTGRMRRNGNDCTIYFIDSAFCDGYSKEQTQRESNSVLYTFYKILHQNMHDTAFRALYEDIYHALEDVITQINEHLEYSEDFEYE